MKKTRCLLLVSSLVLSGCCTKERCVSTFIVKLTNDTEADVQKSFVVAKTVAIPQDTVYFTYGSTLHLTDLTDPEIRIVTPRKSTSLTLKFGRARCNQCTFGFMNDQFQTIEGYTLNGKSVDSTSITID